MMRVAQGRRLDRPDLAGADGGPALTVLYDRHAPGLHRYLANRLDVTTADDLVAETFLRAWELRHRYRPELASAKSWLYGIATNLIREHVRSHARAARAFARDGGRATPAEATDVTATDRVHASTQARRLADALSELRPESRDALLLVAWAGLTPAEVAAALDVNVTTIRTRLHRARTALRGCLDTEEDGDD